MSYIRKAIANRHWGRVAAVIIAGVTIAAVYLYGISRFFEVGSFQFIAAILLIPFLLDWVLAWENERAIESGHITLWNELVGTEVVVSENFVEAAKGYRGAVTLGHERWQAVSDVPLDEGMVVEVCGRTGLVLTVKASMS